MKSLRRRKWLLTGIVVGGVTFGLLTWGLVAGVRALAGAVTASAPTVSQLAGATITVPESLQTLPCVQRLTELTPAQVFSANISTQDLIHLAQSCANDLASVLCLDGQCLHETSNAEKHPEEMI